jgi:hypothetical protein
LKIYCYGCFKKGNTPATEGGKKEKAKLNFNKKFAELFEKSLIYA